MTQLNAMTVDVEDYFHVSALAEVISRKDWARMEFRAEQSTDRLLAMFAEKNIKATFFVLGWVTQKTPQLIRRIHDAGHEIACHGLTNSSTVRRPRSSARKRAPRSRCSRTPSARP